MAFGVLSQNWAYWVRSWNHEGSILGVYWGCIGIMEKKMETTIMGCIDWASVLGPEYKTAPNV